ncbi:hypothetical protein IJJ08_01135 [bacterium]|nr:hypothetical protein [bacterium]
MLNKRNQIITNTEAVNFTIDESGLYAITIIARCEKTQELRIEVDSQYFREINPSKYVQKYKIPPSWNGNSLLGAAQINIFIVNLNKGKHSLSFIPKGQAEIINWNYSSINKDKSEFAFNLQSEYRNIQPWINFILVDMPLDSIVATATTSWYWHDGDDLQLKIDGRIRQGKHSEKNKNWLWHALCGMSDRSQTFDLMTHLHKGRHTIEFIADGKPTLHNVTLRFFGDKHKELSFREKMIDESVRREFPNAQKLDCYTEYYGVKNKPALIIYNGGEEPKATDYRVYYWINPGWIPIYLYDKNHKSETKFDLGINIERPQPDGAQPLPEGWLAFNIGTTLRVLYTPFDIWDWNDDTRWAVYKVK